MITIGEQIQAVVEKQIFSGLALIRYQGWVIFVEGALQGEEILFEITAKKKSYYLGKLLKIVQPSRERRVPPCPYIRSCGGCQLQELQYEGQTALKSSWLQEAFSHALSYTKPILVVPAPFEWAYRRKITLHLRSQEGRTVIGFIGKDNESLIEISSCLLFTEEARLFEKIRQAISFLQGTPLVEGHLTILKVRDKFYGELVCTSSIPTGITQAKAALTQAGIEMRSSKERIVETIEGLTLYVSPRVFLQNYPEASLLLYREVLKQLQGKRVLDLYSGVGLLTQMIAKQADYVCGIESNSEAVQLARESAKSNRLTNIDFIAGSVENTLQPSLLKKQFSSWIINPPRQGLSEGMRAKISEYLPEEMIYISCMPTTLIRDVAPLLSQYEITFCQGFDLFPQTTHIETVLVLRKRK